MRDRDDRAWPNVYATSAAAAALLDAGLDYTDFPAVHAALAVQLGR